jgi:hypothetical protein
MSKEKYVYLVERGALNRTENTYQFYDIEAFTSHKKAEQSIADSIRINEGFDIVRQDPSFKSLPNLTYYLVDYKTISYDLNRRKVSLRIKVSKRKLK